jgi:hypothetical protein
MVDDRKQEDGFIGQLLGLPRLTRIIIAGTFALAVTLAVSPIIDEIYLRNFFSPDTRIVPSLIAATFGLGMYAAGWLTIVGTVGEDPEARPLVKIYLIVGVLALVIVAIWSIRLIIIGGTT